MTLKNKIDKKNKFDGPTDKVARQSSQGQSSRKLARPAGREERKEKNKAGYTATLVACGWAGAVMK